MILTIIGDCPKCLDPIEAEYSINPSGNYFQIELGDVLEGKFLCKRCNKEISAMSLITHELVSGKLR